MPARRVFESVEHNLRRAVGNRIAILVRDEPQVRQRQRPHPAAADLDARQPLCVVPEHRAPVMTPVVVRVLEHDDAVAQLRMVADRAFGIGVVLRDPQASARIRGQADGLMHVRLGGERGQAKPWRELCLRDHLRHGRGTIGGGLGVDRLRNGGRCHGGNQRQEGMADDAVHASPPILPDPGAGASKCFGKPGSAGRRE
jgi:hypothetical protein